jgi:PKD repeat protein
MKIRMKKQLALIIIFLTSLGSTNAQDSTSILFIGNSYTYFNNMPDILSNIAASFGNHVQHASQTPGGMTLAGHAGNTATYNAMNNENWDYVVLQAQSQEPSFPYGQVNNQTLPFAMQLADSAQAISTCSQAMFFMTWGRENGDPQWDSINTFDKMNERLRLAYLRFADSSNASVSPVGVAWKYVRDNHPEMNLYSGDGSHPSYAGSYLAACTFYASIFHSSPVGSVFSGSLNSSDALILQEAASLCVMDSTEIWGLKHHDSLASVSFSYNIDTINLSVGFNENIAFVDSIEWDFGDGNTSFLSNPSHSYSDAGEYSVQLIGYSACLGDTATQNILIEIPFGGLEQQPGEVNYTLKRISENTYCLSSLDQNSIDDIAVQDLLGRTLKSTLNELNKHSVHIEVFQRGQLLLRFNLNGEEHLLRIYH